MTPSPIRSAAEALLARTGSFSSSELSRAAGRTRQGLHPHLVRWVEEGWLETTGQGRATRYRRHRDTPFDRDYAAVGVDEDLVLEHLRLWLARAGRTPTPASDALLEHTLRELLANAATHSGADTVSVRAAFADGRLELTVSDEGPGLWARLVSLLHLEDPPHAALELSKGRCTTDPSRHTGQGLWTTSRLVDRLEVSAGGLAWLVDHDLPDQALLDVPPHPGTRIRATLALDHLLDPAQRLQRLGHPRTTHLSLRLVEHGPRLLSRAQARRLTPRLDLFDEVHLDFTGITGLGQAFVDELFRVWSTAHPHVRLVPRNAGPAVRFMLAEGLAPVGDPIH